MQNYMRNGGMGMQTDGGGFGSRPGGGQMTPNSGGGMGSNVPSAIMGAMGGGSMPYQGWNQWNNFGMGQQPPQYTDAMARMQQQCMAGDGDACNRLQIMQARMGEQNNQWAQQYGQRQQMYNAIKPGTPGGGRGY